MLFVYQVLFGAFVMLGGDGFVYLEHAFFFDVAGGVLTPALHLYCQYGALGLV